MSVIEAPVQTARKTFYSRAANLIVQISAGQETLRDGKSARMGEKIIEFREFRPGWGSAYTEDAECIEKLKLRGDVYEEEAYRELLLSPEAKNKMLVAEKERVITENNRLIEMLAKEREDFAVLQAAADKGKKKPIGTPEAE